MIDFSNCEIDVASSYRGNDQKIAIIYNGDRYMLKVSNEIPEGRTMAYSDRFSNGYLSEKVCCDIIRDLGYDVQETLLGFYQNESGVRRNVVACKNFIPEGWELIDFHTIEDALLDKKPKRYPTLEGMTEIFNNKSPYFPTEQIRTEAKERYWDTFILDALFGNFDRHSGNWGYLVQADYDNQGIHVHDIKLAPIFDCGSCLYPQVGEQYFNAILSSEEELVARIDRFPNAALELPDKKRANYRQFIYSCECDDCTDALLRVYPKLNMDHISSIIKGEEISLERQVFYEEMIRERYERILQPAYEKALALRKQKETVYEKR